MTVLATVVSILLFVAASAAVHSVTSVRLDGGSLSAPQKPACADLGELIVDVDQGMSELATATGAERVEALADVRELSAEAHALTATIADQKVAAAAEKAATALDDVIATIAAVPVGGAPADPASALRAFTEAEDQLTTLSAALTELDSACR